jgi:DnaK suppressor protein
MTAQQLDHFREKLQTRLAEVDLAIGDAKARAVEPTSDESIDRGDDAVRDLLVDTSLEVGELRTHEREEINDALLRIELGEYGVCEECGNPIELDRLEVMPATRFCKEDARRHDARRAPTL